MGSLCLSSASILRCESFTRIQVILLVIPTALEVIFSTSLVFTNWGTGRRHLWLTAEGWIYFGLAVVEMLSHILPAARDSAEIYKVLDTVLAAASFLPILLYMIFLFLLSQAELIDILPTRFQTIAKLMILIFIPAIVALNEVASFIGLSYRLIPVGPSILLAVGFRTSKDQILWTFFTSLTLALLTAYQAINFSLTFYRLTKVFIDQRQIESGSSEEIHLFKGIGWISGGYKLGVIETAVGFAGGGFGGAFTRRILRFLARAFLCIGLVKGVDSIEDFQQVRSELGGNRKEIRRSRLREFISNPRLSTFHQLTPTATAFHAKSRAPHGLSQISSARATDGLPGMKQFATIKDFTRLGDGSEKPRERVTVHFDNGAPTLHMRFSALNFPSPIFNVRSRPQSEWVPISRPVSYGRMAYQDVPPSAPSILSSLALSDSGPHLANLPLPHNTPSQQPRTQSAYSIPESYTSLTDVRELASQFPGPPSHTLETVKQSPAPNTQGDFWDPPSPVTTQEDVGSNLSHGSSMSKRKPVPTMSPIYSLANPFGSNEELPTVVPLSIPLGQPIRTLRRPSAQFNYDVSLPTSATTTPMTIMSGYAQTLTGQSVLTPDTEDGFIDLGTALHGAKSREVMRRSSGVTKQADWIDYDAIRPIDKLPSIVIDEGHKGRVRTASDATSYRESNLRQSEGLDGLAIPWLKPPNVEEEERRIARSMRKTDLSRIKSVGKAPRRSTPVPVRTRYARGSLHIEPIMIPPKERGMTEAIQGSLDSTYSRSVLRDSEVLGIEDGSLAKARKERGYF
ncbi:hypothetical protein BDZ94DRAFT_633486 [Collybia nuda]|uniref:Uncharacterized protein n=1 Tax=Collybia nuda TaxID=64659 RepID=A0A9P6CEQ6_9AGAR|nr:hypothetical protein BDZ94DRAFT_633486 [Collybia nuda]